MKIKVGYKRYKGFGLKILSEIDLPEFQIDNKSEEIGNDVFVTLCDLKNEWLNKSREGKYFIVEKDYCLFEVPDVAIYLIKDGNSIFVSPYPGAADGLINLYILGTCMGALLMQRKVFPLHGSALAIGGKSYAIIGESGAGKSTLATSLLNKGSKLISDDVIPVILNESGLPTLLPSYPQQKLWNESLKNFQMDSNKYKPIVQRENKFTVPVIEKFERNQLPLAGIFELTKNNDTGISIKSVPKLSRFPIIFNHTYRNFFLHGLGLLNWHLNFSARIISCVNFHHISRPDNCFTANNIAEMILTTIKKEENIYAQK